MAARMVSSLTGKVLEGDALIVRMVSVSRTDGAYKYLSFDGGRMGFQSSAELKAWVDMRLADTIDEEWNEPPARGRMEVSY